MQWIENKSLYKTLYRQDNTSDLPSVISLMRKYGYML